MTSQPAKNIQDPGRKEYLHGGQIVATKEPTQITSILGSCIAVCLWDPRLGIGGMNHYLLPFGHRHEDLKSARYGNVAIPMLIEQLVDLGANVKRLQAKVFGGASSINPGKPGVHHVGARNAEAAQELLLERRIPIVSHDTGGANGRKVIFHTNTGEAWVRLIQANKLEK